MNYTSEITQAVIQATEQNTQQLIDAVALFNPHNFNTIPFEGSWTAGQVCEHIFMAEDGMADHLFNGPTEPANRAPDKFDNDVKSMFLDLNTKMQAPDFVLPNDVPKEQATLVLGLKKNRIEIIKSIQNLDLTQLCLESEFPGYGYLTRYEWLYFNIYHAQRHIHQLTTIHKILVNSQ